MLRRRDIIERIRQDRPELKSFRDMLDKAKTEYSLSKQELLPDISFSISMKNKMVILARANGWAL